MTQNHTKFHVPVFRSNVCAVCGRKVRPGFAQRSHSIGHVNKGEAMKTETKRGDVFTIPPTEPVNRDT